MHPHVARLVARILVHTHVLLPQPVDPLESTFRSDLEHLPPDLDVGVRVRCVLNAQRHLRIALEITHLLRTVN